ncbi:hypothetical protein HYU19_05780 [Candidatus Woesearchaeota archaeon]|nr:hypothetical protein [Candidatus Woesearchaeota archaeon]
MRFLKAISALNKKVPVLVRFIISLMLFNVPPVAYLNKADPTIAPLYVAIVFLLINITALIAYFKIKVVEVESTFGKIKVQK